jgi:hypothetical protein
MRRLAIAAMSEPIGAEMAAEADAKVDKKLMRRMRTMSRADKERLVALLSGYHRRVGDRSSLTKQNVGLDVVKHIADALETKVIVPYASHPGYLFVYSLADEKTYNVVYASRELQRTEHNLFKDMFFVDRTTFIFKNRSGYHIATLDLSDDDLSLEATIVHDIPASYELQRPPYLNPEAPTIECPPKSIVTFSFDGTDAYEINVYFTESGKIAKSRFVSKKRLLYSFDFRGNVFVAFEGNDFRVLDPFSNNLTPKRVELGSTRKWIPYEAGKMLLGRANRNALVAYATSDANSDASSSATTFFVQEYELKAGASSVIDFKIMGGMFIASDGSVFVPPAKRPKVQATEVLELTFVKSILGWDRMVPKVIFENVVAVYLGSAVCGFITRIGDEAKFEKINRVAQANVTDSSVVGVSKKERLVAIHREFLEDGFAIKNDLLLMSTETMDIVKVIEPKVRGDFSFVRVVNQENEDVSDLL